MSKLVDVIKKMTVMDLVNEIKAIEEEFGVSASAPVAAVAAPGAAGGEAAAEEKSEFNVTLKDVGSEKIKVIKALRSAIPDLNLKDAKEKVESAPCTIAENAPKDDAKKMKEVLEAAGAKVELS